MVLVKGAAGAEDAEDLPIAQELRHSNLRKENLGDVLGTVHQVKFFPPQSA